jgi:type IV secretion system protein VirB10
MSNNYNEPDNLHEKEGALPSLDGAGNDEILGVPESKLKSKTNVKKTVYLLFFLAGALFLVFGVLFFMKSRAERLAAQEKAQPVRTASAGKGDQTKVRNAALTNQSLERVKAEIMTREEADAQVKAAGIERNQAAGMVAAGGVAAPGGAYGRGNTGAGAPGVANGSYQGQGNTQVQPAPRPLTLREQQLAGNVLAFGATTGAQSTSAAAVAAPEPQARKRAARFASDDQPDDEPSAASSGPRLADSQNKGGMADMLKPTVLQARRAGRLGNLDYLLKKGMTIPCALRTGIDTTLPGFLTCVAVSDVYSANGVTKLVERGATFFGEQKSTISQGQTRVFVVWNRIDNPSGIFAELDSPATDEMGYAGIGGHVDDRFWKRFGGAIMLSLIQDSVQAAAQSRQESGGVSISNTSGAGSQMATEALKGTINIPPTITVLPGKILNVMVARDVSFESVYGLVK